MRRGVAAESYCRPGWTASVAREALQSLTVMLPQGEADALFGMSKRFRSMAALDVAPGVDYRRELDSFDSTEAFLLDVRTNQIRLTKFRYQSRGRRVVILARLCVGGPPHTNPDGVQVGRTHVHRYREGYEDRFADPIDPALFSNLADRSVTLAEFCRYCNIDPLPQIVEAGTMGGPA